MIQRPSSSGFPSLPPYYGMSNAGPLSSTVFTLPSHHGRADALPRNWQLLGNVHALAKVLWGAEDEKNLE